MIVFWLLKNNQESTLFVLASHMYILKLKGNPFPQTYCINKEYVLL